MGTLGVVTLLEIELIVGARYVELTYWSVGSALEAVDKVMEETRRKENAFVDGIMFARDKGLVLTGQFTDKADHPVARFARARDNWFYLHAEKHFQPPSAKTNHPRPVRFSVPLKDYFFRYDRGAFWMARYAFKYFSFAPFDRFSRFCMDSLLHTRPMYRAMHYSGHYNKYLIQDLGLPIHNAGDFMDWVDDELEIYPLWLCPLRCGHGTSWLRPDPSGKPRFFYRPSLSGLDAQNGDVSDGKQQANEEMVFNVGVWGPGPKSRKDFVAINRKIEAKVSELGGIKWPYSQYYYTEDEFWQIYDREAYTELRRKYRAETLPTMYDKIKPRSDDLEEKKGPPNGSRGLHGRLLTLLWDVWPVSGLYGLAKVLLSREYLIERLKTDGAPEKAKAD